MAYAVVDLETTGLLPSYHHRVVEIGITHVDDEGAITGRWETLINPKRDLGPQSIHGVRGVDLIDAPLFEDIAGDVLGMLQGRTFVAHNARFDIGFLVAEFVRSGFYFGDSVPHLCTMALARSFGLSGRAALDSCCSHFGVELVNAHSAGADSYAAAQLLEAYIGSTSESEEWHNYWKQASQLGATFQYPTAPSRGVVWKPRGFLLAEPQHFLELISDPPLEVPAEGAEDSYLEALDRVLLDHKISATENAELSEVATTLGLSRSAVEVLNRRYFDALLTRAWADGVLTEDELNDLQTVANLLLIDPASWDTSKPEQSKDEVVIEEFKLSIGDHVVLTGEMSIPRSEWEDVLTVAGYCPHPRITKITKLLVSADPDSLSGKAQQARKYGIPVVGEEWLRDNLR